MYVIIFTKPGTFLAPKVISGYVSKEDASAALAIRGFPNPNARGESQKGQIVARVVETRDRSLLAFDEVIREMSV